MNTYSRPLLCMLGLALALLAARAVVVAINLSQDIATLQQQAQAWKNYAMTIQHQSLLGHVVADDYPAARGRVEGLETLAALALPEHKRAIEWQRPLPDSPPAKPRGVSF
ncbi:MAG TPA: hypothetical protein VLC30_13460 [Pseudomonas sp.]|nr:hypothetical protein [Pseudomonas sp.]